MIADRRSWTTYGQPRGDSVFGGIWKDVASEVDTRDAIARFERELHDGADADRREFLLAILARWAVDSDLTAASRQRAREVLYRFRRGH